MEVEKNGGDPEGAQAHPRRVLDGGRLGLGRALNGHRLVSGCRSLVFFLFGRHAVEAALLAGRPPGAGSPVEICPGQMVSGSIMIAPQGHSAAQSPQPLQKS